MNGKGSNRRPRGRVSEDQFAANWESIFGKRKVGYSETHDAAFDPDTREWLESQCGDPECDRCKDRPEKA